MKKKTKALWILLAVGIAGIAATMGYLFGSGALMSREAVKTYEISELYNTLQLKTSLAQVSVLPEQTGETRVEAYVKAWLPDEIDMDDVVSVSVKDGALTVTETPFPSEFLGVFPQPYEMNLRVYLPQDIYERYTGDQS